MRSQKVTLAGKEITINEQKIKKLRDETLPKMGPAWESLKGTDMSEIINNFGESLKSVFSEMKDIDLDECYPSEVESFLEAWISVNFTGLKRLLGPLLRLVEMGLLNSGLDSENPLVGLITGSSSQYQS
jgi:hypothetical protein